MPGLFQGLEIGRRALLANQVTIQTIGHNIANVNTPGFTRQRVRITSANPQEMTYGVVGNGVRVDDIRHVRDLFLREQYRDANKSLGKWTYREKTLSQIETLVNEPFDNSLNDQLNAFWSAWSTLSTDFDSTNHRQSVLSEASKLINGFNRLAGQLDNLRSGIDRDLNDLTDEVNRLTTEIARLNKGIQAEELGGSRANDLRDQRDRLTDELSNIIDVRTVEKPTGATIVYMGAMVVVDGSDSFNIDTVTETRSSVSANRIVYKGTTVELTNISGQLAGLIESRDEIIPAYLENLNDLAKTLVEQVNAIHQSGYGKDGSTGVAFFDPSFTDAVTIRLNMDVEQNINSIAASSVATGDNLIALQLAQLRDATVMADSSSTMNDFYASFVGKMGIESREAKSSASNFELIRQQVDNARMSVEGVSLDEEMTNLIKFQQAYDAAARVITAMDQALDTVIGRMGIVGR